MKKDIKFSLVIDHRQIRDDKNITKNYVVMNEKQIISSKKIFR